MFAGVSVLAAAGLFVCFAGREGFLMESIAARSFLVVVLSALYGYYLAWSEKCLVASGKWLQLVLWGVLYLVVSRLMLDLHLPLGLNPLAFFCVVFVLVHGVHTAVVTAVYLLSVMVLVLGNEVAWVFVWFAGVFVVIFGSRHIDSRWKLMKVGFFSGVLQGFMVLAVWLGGFASGVLVPWFDSAIAVAGGFVYPGVLANAFLPVLEYLLGVTTHLKLLEISSQNHPLLKRLIMEAPGTYHHSLVVGNLAEAAAEAIGADWLLARVGAYYHDIGKLEKPMYFNENAGGTPDLHRNLSPHMSALIIIAHTRDGVQIAKRYGLPPEIVEFIEQHHGTSVVEYFYQRALTEGGKGGKPARDRFAYAGPRPRRKEVAIVMLADTTEATVRSLKDPTPARIRSVVEEVVTKKVLDGQLDDCDMTFGELKKVKDSFFRVLAGMFHSRSRRDDGRKQEKEQEEKERGNGDKQAG